MCFSPNLVDKKHQKSKQDCFEAITALRRELEASMKHENSRVYMEISAKYPEDIEVVIILIIVRHFMML